MQPIKGARQTELIVMIALFSALITVMTAFIKIPTPLGYIHIGDAFIFAAAMLLGPYAAIPAMIGSGLADFITAYFMYIPVTILISRPHSAPCRSISFKALRVLSSAWS